MDKRRFAGLRIANDSLTVKPNKSEDYAPSISNDHATVSTVLGTA